MSREQLEYMFEMMYAPENLRKAMGGGQKFLIFSEEEDEAAGGREGAGPEDVGYVAYEVLGGGCYYLQKIYLLPQMQGSGQGRKMLEMFLEHLRELDAEAKTLGLNVNRENAKALKFYKRNGFEVTGRRDHPIGRGYYMNDYILERKI